VVVASDIKIAACQKIKGIKFMNCSSCQGYQLTPVELEKGLVAAECGKCQGTLLPLMNYEFWRNSQESFPELSGDICQHDASDTKTARFCPKCSRLMAKFKLAGHANNRLDYCAACSEVWLDEGEWDLLKKLNIIGHLSEILTDGWQKQIRLDQQDATIRNRYLELMGENDFDRLKSFKQWLKQHPAKVEMKQFINS